MSLAALFGAPCSLSSTLSVSFSDAFAFYANVAAIDATEESAKITLA